MTYFERMSTDVKLYFSYLQVAGDQQQFGCDWNGEGDLPTGYKSVRCGIDYNEICFS